MTKKEQDKKRFPGINSREAHPVAALNLVKEIYDVEDPQSPVTQKTLAQLEMRNNIIPEARATLRKAA